MSSTTYSVKDITKTAMMAAITFVGIYAVKIPSLHGYSHMGDCMIFLSVLLLGTRRGALAGGIGAALSDLLGGYMHWILPTFIIKYIMAAVMGLFIDKIMPNIKCNWLIGSIVGGIVQIVLYTSFKVFMFDWAYALGSVPGLTSQTFTGVVLGAVLVLLFNKAGIMQRLREM
nr:ECF transporter S component [uncultured Anaerotignum sp.]